MMLTLKKLGAVSAVALLALASQAEANGLPRQHVAKRAAESVPRGGWKVAIDGKPASVIESVKAESSKVSSKVASKVSSKVSSKVPSEVSSKVSTKAVVILGLILAFNSGFINGVCLSGLASANKKQQAVAAVTASWTNSALGLATGDNSKFAFLSKMILSFVSGSTIASLLNPNPVPFQIAQGSFASSFYIAAVMLVVSAAKLSDSAGTVEMGMFLAAMANGIQNSITSTLTQNLCRTSHFTGISSDMGTFLGQVLRGNKANLLKLKVFAGLATCFWIGGYVSYESTKSYGSMALYFSAALYVLVGSFYSKIASKM